MKSTPTGHFRFGKVFNCLFLQIPKQQVTEAGLGEDDLLQSVQCISQTAVFTKSTILSVSREGSLKESRGPVRSSDSGVQPTG